MKPPSFRLTRIWQQITFEHVLVLCYELVFLRQYFWLVETQQIAWTITVTAGLLIWIAFLFFKPSRRIRTPWQFWLIVGIPLLAVYAIRAAIPDTSFDVLNYRLVNAERSMRGWPNLAADFLPAFYPLNPAPDMIMALGRWIAGYRMGTMVNLGALLWTGIIINRLLHSQIKRTVLRCGCILVILWTEHSLFLINNYLVDLLAIPLLLRMTEIAIDEDHRDYFYAGAFGLLAGASVALKLFNVAFVIPIAIIYLWNTAKARGRIEFAAMAKKMLLATGAAVLPLLPFTAYIYRETGNPVFPFYNPVFKSPLWPQSNAGDGRWGPTTLFETVNWPLTIAFRRARIGELAYYSGRITIAMAAVIVTFIFFRRQRRLVQLALIVLTSAALWSAILTGYPRYGIFGEVAGGVLGVILVAKLLASKTQSARVLALVFCGIIAAQLAWATFFISKYEWSMRPTVFEAPGRYKDEARFILRDRSFRSFLRDDSKQLAASEFWIESGMLTSGVQALANPRAPILCAYVPDYFSVPEGRERFARALDAAGDRTINSLCLESEMDGCRKAISDQDLEIISATPVNIPVYSERTLLKMVYLSLRRREKSY